MRIKFYEETPDNIERAGYWRCVDAEISTADLITELEKRDKCAGCEFKPYYRALEVCLKYVRSQVVNDNFKADKAKGEGR